MSHMRSESDMAHLAASDSFRIGILRIATYMDSAYNQA